MKLGVQFGDGIPVVDNLFVKCIDAPRAADSMTTGPLATRCGARSLPRPAGIEGVRTWVTALVVRAGRFPVWVAAGWVWCGSMALLAGRLG